MNPTLPLPGQEYNKNWASDLVRVLQAVVDDLGRQAGLGYRAGSYQPSRQITGNVTSCEGEVGTVAVAIDGVIDTLVPVAGVGGAGTAPTNEQLANVLATLIADFQGKGTLG